MKASDIHASNEINKGIEIRDGMLASFPGSPCARTKDRRKGLPRFSVLEATENWAGPGNEANGMYKL